MIEKSFSPVLVLLAVSLVGCDGQNTTATARGGAGNPPSGDASVSWVRFQDPAEQAFSMEVPKSWMVKGGLYRIGYFDYRPMVEIRSADGKANIRYGDVGVPPYTPPDRQHRDGGQIVMDAQAQITVAAFRPGAEYVRYYAPSRFKSECSQPVPYAGTLGIFRAAGLPQSDSVDESEGQAAYSCSSGADPAIAFVYAKTIRHRGTAIWTVVPVVSFLSPKSQLAQTWEIANRFAQSFKINPAWIPHQAEMDQQGTLYARAVAQGKMQALSQQVQQFHARMAAMSAQVAGFERRMDAQAAQVQGFGDILTGITRTADPLTGTEHQVWTGQSDQYWINGKGQTVSSPTSPGPGFRPLNTISH